MSTVLLVISIKLVAAAERLLPNAPRELPYEGAKPMILVENTDDRELLCRLFNGMYDELPAPKVGKKK